MKKEVHRELYRELHRELMKELRRELRKKLRKELRKEREVLNLKEHSSGNGRAKPCRSLFNITKLETPKI